MTDILVAKIGGSTLGSHDTTLEDLAEVQRRGLRPVVVHGGGAVISEWLSRHNVETRFERGLRVTDEESLKVVVAVLAGLVNKQLVAALQSLGARATGLSGADESVLRSRIADEALGFVGEVTAVNVQPVLQLIESGTMPVIAPIGMEWNGERPTGQLLNINADTAAGAVAAALHARWLAFLTDVAGVRDASGGTLEALDEGGAQELVAAGVIEGGMIPKVEACLTAARAGCESVIVDGREAGSLLGLVEGRVTGTRVV